MTADYIITVDVQQRATDVYPASPAMGAVISVAAYFTWIPRFGTYGAAAALPGKKAGSASLMITLSHLATLRLAAEPAVVPL